MTFIESREVIAWMQEMAAARKTDLAVILREATSAYYLQHRVASVKPTLSEARAAAKAAARVATARKIASGKLTPDEAQKLNAPIRGRVQVVDLWPSIRRHVLRTKTV